MATLVDAGFIAAIGRDPDARIAASAPDAIGDTWQVWAAGRWADGDRG